MTDNGLSAGDILALAKDNEGFLEGNGIIILILFLVLLGAGGNGLFGGSSSREAALTQTELQSGLYNQTANADRLALMQQVNQNARDILENRYQSALQNQTTLSQLQSCCCETNRNIDSVRAENYKNTCDITNAIHSEGEATRALINANVMQGLRDQNTAYQLQLSNQAQTANLINQLRPFPTPAYITCSPYQTNVGCGTCGASCGV